MKANFLNMLNQEASLKRVTAILLLSSTLVACGGGTGTSVPPSSVSAKTQTITFTPIATQTLPAAAIALSASASSGLGVSFVSGTPVVCTVSGASLSLVAGGSCTVTALQAGDTTYAAASPVAQTFTVNKAPQTLTFGAVSSQPAVGATYALQASSSATGLVVSYAAAPSAVCSVSGTTLTAIAAGTCTVTASQAGNAVYAAATNVQQTITIAAATPAPALASAANGKIAYAAQCAGCHGTAPNITGGATRAGNQPALIQAAIGGSVAAMAGLGPVDSAGKITTQNINDIALFLAAPY